MFWIFAARIEAEEVNDALSATLPIDRMVDGAEAPQQVTQQWSDIYDLGDGRFAIFAFPGVEIPIGVVEAVETLPDARV